MKHLLSFVLLLITFSSQGQKAYRFTEKEVNQNGKTLPMAFAGGINAAQIQTMDVNGNGTEELVIWDINSRNLKIFEQNEGTFTHLPYMHHFFPEDVSGFLVLADFDGDGKKDLFTSTAFGIKAYRNVTPQGQSFPSWEVAENFLKLENGSNFQANNLDVPAIQDLDGDGDLDVVIFNFAVGDYLEYYQNTSVERNGSPGVDGFAPQKVRWGNFEFCGCGDFSFGRTCDGDLISRKLPQNQENNSTKHSGGHSVLLRDFNNDGVLDLVMGQDECNTLYYLPNQGSNTAPLFTSAETSIPGFGKMPTFPIFHVGQYLNDNLLISSNSSQTSLTAGIDFSQSIYQLEGTNPALKTSAFLQEDMVDLGENTRPFFKGNNASGQLIVTANTIQNGTAIGQAFSYAWNGETMELTDTDHLNLSSLGLTDLQYLEVTSAAQQQHLFISGVKIEDFVLTRDLFYSQSGAADDLTPVDIPNITLRANDHFDYYQYNGENFMLLARQTGELLRYKVSFDEIPTFELLNEDYLGFSDNPSRRNLAVKSAPSNGRLDLYTVDQRGILGYLPDFIHSNSPQSELLTLPNGDMTTTRLGRNTWIATVPAAFGGKTHLVLGNNGGGVQLLEDISNGIDPPVDGQLQVNLYPNPSSGPAFLLSNESGKARMVNSLGQVLVEEFNIEANTPAEMDVRTLASGIYFVQFTADTGKGTTKKLIVE
ncbi:T9SS C-terminal target domain-containing protein [Echinicola strongylocentroti]|uniref:T9SS C-terminal target domain-containing protein n=1 Tax=Echinicola strongylocentroti TaxID=1795355 RepID=A0A2Z4ILF0_9BACT|nr:T9SS type A sorting domain-containing protein [Echinicola strongylocentroti]AWW31398.1 T9SS C-terminal target domain-containing protein [Echinicola strongylocentroti]